MQYIALTQRCNYFCKCCPCINHNTSSDIDFDKIKMKIDNLPDGTTEKITLSGGEPTIYDHFFDVMQLLNKKGAKVVFLTNSSKLSSDDFLKKLDSIYPLKDLEIVTTLYSVYSWQHDNESGSVGSFANTLNAIHKLEAYGTKITLKFCITKSNYLQLRLFYDFLKENFSDEIGFQISGIDYVGMPEEIQQQMKLTCKEIRCQLDPLLEQINFLKANKLDKRIVFISSLPLCSASLKYRNFFVSNGDMGRIDYLSANRDIKKRHYDSVKNSTLCSECCVFDICPGTYASTFKLMGDSYVLPFLKN